MRTFHVSALAVLSSALALAAQIQREPVPDLEAYLHVEHEIEPAGELTSAPIEGRLQGMEENLPPVRTAESVFEEVRLQQGKLTHQYKTWKIRGEQGVEGRNYGLILTIGPSGDVMKVVVQGHKHPAFLAEVEAQVKTWSFAKVKEAKPYVARLKNLDFLHRKELILE